MTTECELFNKRLAEKERSYNAVAHNLEKINLECAQWHESCDKLTAVLNETADSVTIDSDEYNSLLSEVDELTSELADYKYIFHLLRTRSGGIE